MPRRHELMGHGGSGRPWARTALAAVVGLGLLPSLAGAQGPPAAPAPPPTQQASGTPGPASAPETAEDSNERRATERFLSLLEKSPRRGTALDRVYGFHVERNSLDPLIQQYRDRTAKDPKDGAAWMLLGLLESQRGRDAAAVAAFRAAESARPDDAIASYYLGQSLTLVGDNAGAAAALERAIDRKPRRTDLLEIFQALGRIYQRAQQPDRALAVWNRLETLFPTDLRVQEQAAAALAEEGQFDQALTRYEALSRKATDPFRQVELAAQAADLKARLGRADQALRDYEGILGRLRPESWLFREVRRKVEDVFLRNDDQAGLAQYYEGWVGRNPEDVEAHVRLARTLQNLGRATDARRWFDKAITLAPTRRDLRLALAAQAEQEAKFADAAAQYAALDRADPNNPDTLRDWGSLLLRDTSQPEASRAPSAQAIWRRLLDNRPTDPVTVAQVADLYRQAGLVDDALSLYRRAVDLAPGNPQYIEYLGEYLHTLKRADEAQAAWAKIAAEPNRTARNLARLGEVLAGFGYNRPAVEPTRQAVALEGEDFTLRLKFADLLFRVEQYDEAMAQLAEAGRLATRDEERAAVLDAELKNDLAAGRIAARTKALTEAVATDPTAATTDSRIKLARYQEADGKLPDALRTAQAAVAASPTAVVAWTLMARLHESNGDLQAAADAHRRLSEVDRRNRTESLTAVAKLEARLGRTEEALKAGRDLIAAAPGNPESYGFFADLCFGLNRQDEGLDALRRAARVNPNDTKVVLTLADSLAGQFRTDEAIEMYWRAFSKAESLDTKLGVIPRLTDLYLQINQFDRLLARLQRQDETGVQLTPAQGREQSICLAQAYAASGDTGAARAELERLLASNARDVPLLQQLSKLAEDEGDLDSAARFQKQLAEVMPGDEQLARLAGLYARAGEVEAAQALWSKQASAQADPAKVLTTVDSLLGSDRPRSALEIADNLVRKDPHDWEALYRSGVALATLDNRPEAAARFRAVLDQRLDDDAMGAQAKARARDPKLRGVGARASAFTPQAQIDPSLARQSAATTVRTAARIENRITTATTQLAVRTAWAPADFGQGRMAALGWLLSLALKDGNGREQALIDGIKAEAERPGAPARAAWDWYYLSLVRLDSHSAYEAARLLARAPGADVDGLAVYLRSLSMRTNALGVRTVASARMAESADTTPPLPTAEVDLVLATFESLRKRRPDLIYSIIVQAVDTELRRAKRDADRDRFYQQVIQCADLQSPLIAAILLASSRPDVDAMLAVGDRYERLTLASRASGTTTARDYLPGPYAQAMSKLGDAKNYPDALRILDHYLAGARRRHDELVSSARGRSRAALTSAAAGMGSSVTVYSTSGGVVGRSVGLTFPTADSFLDDGTITLLRNAFEVYKRADLASDLVAHVRQSAEAARTPDDAIYPRLALAALLWWDDDKDAALAEYTRGVEATHNDPEMVLKLADLYAQRGEPMEALSLLDSVQPSDNAVLQRREEAVLRLAVQTGQIDRAREAAERLFGLRLDADAQLRLSEQMHQLGLHEPAEALLARSRRRAGNKATALVGLMQQYQRQSKTEVAAQVALQILRSSTPTRPPAGTTVVTSETPDAARSAALQVLARSGRLDDLIRRTEDQVRRVPGSAQLRLTLADYLTAANQRDRARDELKKLAEARPDDLALRLRVAANLVAQNQAAEALPHYAAILKRDPSLLPRSLTPILNAYRQANRVDDLLALLEQADLRAFGSSSQILNLLQNLQGESGNDARGVALFRRVWDAFPAERSNMFLYLRNDAFWQAPEIYNYAVQGLLPDPDAGSYSPVTQWNLLGMILSYGGDGTLTSMVGRVLDMATQQGKLGDLASRVEALNTRLPDWVAGRALLALIRARQNRFDDARAALQPVLALRAADLSTANPDWIIAAELDRTDETRDLAMTFYERAATNRSGNIGSMGDNSPLTRLLKLYERDGRKADARRVLLESARPSDRSNTIYQPDYEAQMRVQTLTTAGTKLIDLGFVADAAPLFNEAAEVADTVSTTGPNYVGNLDELLRQARTGLSQSLTRLQGPDLGTLLSSLVDAAAPGSADPARRSGSPRLDLVLMVTPRELDRATVRSVFADAVARLAADPKALNDFAARVETLASTRPDDIPTQVAAALGALATNDQARIDAALGRLDQTLASHPLEPLPTGTNANARQRASAAPLLAVWLVARVGLSRPTDLALQRRVGVYTTRAIEAARRQLDDRWTMAMLREQGQWATDRGDRAGAEAAWGQMLDSIIPSEPRRKPRSRPAGANPAPGPAAPANPAPPTAPPPGGASVRPAAFQAPSRPVPGANPTARPNPGGPSTPRAANRAEPGVPVLTVDRFERAMQVARLAADHDQADLSLRAVREALRGGPPVEAAVAPAANQRVVALRGGAQVEPVDAITPRVLDHLYALDAIWTARKVPADRVAAVLRDVVLPPARPSEVFLYASGLANNGLRTRLRSVGALAAEWATRAGTVADLRATAVARQANPAAELPARVLVALIALAAQDHPALNLALKDLTERAQRDTLRSSAELVCHAALPALDRAATQESAVALLDLATRGLDRSTVAAVGLSDPSSALNLILARQALRRGDRVAGRQRLTAYAAAADRQMNRLGGDYPLYLRKVTLSSVAAEYARAGMPDELLTTLGEFADAPAYSGGDPSTGASVPILARLLAGRPAAERYASLHDWTLPTGSRRLVRVLGGLASSAAPPADLQATDPGQGAAGPWPEPGPHDTANLLIAAAREAGQLDQLAAEVAPWAEGKEPVENAPLLAQLIALARGQGESIQGAMQTRLAELEKPSPPPGPGGPVGNRRNNPQSPLSRGVGSPDLLLARALIGQEAPALRALGQRFDRLLVRQPQGDNALAILLRRDLATSLVRDAGLAGEAGPLDGGLRDWYPSAGGSLAETSPAAWVSHQGHIARAWGPPGSRLDYAIPLGGTYEFAVDVAGSTTGTSALAHHGILFAATERPQGREEEPIASGTVAGWAEGYTRLTVQATPGLVRYLVAGRLVREERDPSPTSPWLSLVNLGLSPAVWKNATLTGTPTVPREVPLSHDDRLDGWNTELFNESRGPRVAGRPAPTTGAVQPGIAASAGPTDGEVDPENYDWISREGVIRGRKVTTPAPPRGADTLLAGRTTQSQIHYDRPLRDGDEVTYEFFFEPGAVEVHPTLGRLAFLLDPATVRLHWLTTASDTAIDPDNVSLIPAERVGTGPLPLQVGTWNTASLAVLGGEVRLRLNGQEIYRRRVDPASDHHFGLYHDQAATAARVRQVVLRGSWPESLPPERLAAVFAPREGADQSPAARQARHALIGEDAYAQGADEVLAQTARLDPLPRFEALAAWVLPSPDHPVYRLAGGFTPADAPSPAESTEGRARIETGGALQAPALALVAAAREVGKLDDLAARLATPSAGDAERGRLALVGLVRLAQGDGAGAAAALDALGAIPLPSDPTPLGWRRWPDLVLATALSSGADPNTTRPAALRRLDAVIDRLPPSSGQSDAARLWEVQLRHARAVVQSRLALGESAPTIGNDPDPVPGWSAVAHLAALDRSRGAPPAGWSARDGVWTHQPGRGADFLFCNTPLRGNFRLDCEVRLNARSSVQLMYAGLAVGLAEPGSSERTRFGQETERRPVQPPVEPGLDGWLAAHLAVQNHQMSVTVAGRTLYEGPLPVEPDPWLAIRSVAAGEGAVRRVTIQGQPTVPTTLDLAAGDLVGWSGLEYPEIPSDNRLWHKRGGAIVTPVATDPATPPAPTLLRYHRPLREDGEVSLEFFHAPDTNPATLGPALGPIVFLLDPEGVKVHRLSDGPGNHPELISATATATATAEPAARRGDPPLPLRPGAWNTVQLRVRGHTVAVLLNDQLVAERPIEPTNPRTFGLFRLTGRSEAQFRNLQYHGAWPTAVPASPAPGR